MGLRPIVFRDLNHSEKSAIEYWASMIPENLHCKLGTYGKCEEVGDSSNGVAGVSYSMPIGFVLSGKLEICETYEFLGMTAYRPIRILSKGDLFGDFSFLDDELGCNSRTRRGESWKIYSGARSVLITQKIDSHREYVITEGGTTKPHLILPQILQEGARVLFIDGAQLRGHGVCLVEPLLRHSWARAKIYRDCLNSFNFNELLLFKEKAYRCHDDLTSRLSGGRKEYAAAISKEMLLDVFLDAIWDACNRPLRNEPLFGKPNISSEFNNLKDTGITLDNIYLASTSWEANSPLLFPVGSQNFMIGAYAKAVSEGPVNKRRKTIRNDVEKIFEKKNTQRSASGKPANKFYLDLANELISSEILPTYSQYPFDIECKEIQGVHSKMMILEFTKRR